MSNDPTLLDRVIAATEARDAGDEAPPPPKRPWRNAAELLAGRGGRVSNRLEVERRGAREVDPDHER